MNESTQLLYRIKLLNSSKFQKAGTVIPVLYKEYLVGRSDNSNLQFDESWKMVSRNHLKILYTNNTIILSPIHASDNSTLINGKNISKDLEIFLPSVVQCSVNGPKFKIMPLRTSIINNSKLLDILIIMALIILVYQTIIILF